MYVYIVSNCCLSLYLNIAGVLQGPGEMLLGSWKVLEMFVTKRVGTLPVVCCVNCLLVNMLTCLCTPAKEEEEHIPRCFWHSAWKNSHAEDGY